MLPLTLTVGRLLRAVTAEIWPPMTQEAVALYPVPSVIVMGGADVYPNPDMMTGICVITPLITTGVPRIAP